MAPLNQNALEGAITIRVLPSLNYGIDFSNDGVFSSAGWPGSFAFLPAEKLGAIPFGRSRVHPGPESP
ncbi:MAG: hypothetical protein ACYCZO_10875 [Daejeonella sp.]